MKWFKNPFKKYELVEFHDGTYGVRNRITNTYQDFKSLSFWWHSYSEWFETHCKTTRTIAEKKKYLYLTGKDNPVKRVVK